MEKLNKISHQGLTWININNPSQADIDYLEEKYDFHHLDYEDCLTQNQRPKIDRYDDYIFIILQLPILDKKTSRIISVELDMFVTPNAVISLHRGHENINRIFEQCREKVQSQESYMQKGSGYFVYMLLNDIFEACFALVDDLTYEAKTLEKEVFEVNQSTDKLKDILSLKKDLINFRRIILPQRSVIAQLEHIYMGQDQNQDLEVYFDNVVDKIEKIYSNLENQKEIVNSLQETNEAIIFHNTNNVIRVLTVFSVIMMPLSVITGFYGMNVSLPYEQSSLAFMGVAMFMFCVLVLMLLFFKYKKWI